MSWLGQTTEKYGQIRVQSRFFWRGSRARLRDSQVRPSLNALCRLQHAHGHVGSPAAAVDGRCGRAAVQARLPAEDCLFPAGDHVSPAGGPPQAGSWSSLSARMRSTMAASLAGGSPLARDVQPELLPVGVFGARQLTVQINLASGVNPEHLNYFKSSAASSALPYSIIGSPMHTSSRVSIRWVSTKR